MTAGEVLHLRPLVDGTCETHAWTLEQMRIELLPLMRARHRKGGVTVCTDCVARLKTHLEAKLARTL